LDQKHRRWTEAGRRFFTAYIRSYFVPEDAVSGEKYVVPEFEDGTAKAFAAQNVDGPEGRARQELGSRGP
jgi:hypothetical protein